MTTQATVLILNASANRDGWEDDFCERLTSEITFPCSNVQARATQIQARARDDRNSTVIVVVAHGRSHDREITQIDLGFEHTDLIEELKV